MCFTHPKCWQWRSPAQGQYVLGSLPSASQDSKSVRSLEATKQRSRSIGLAEQTGKRRATQSKNEANFSGVMQTVTDKHMLRYTFMDSTAEVWAAVGLVVTSAASISFGCILGALAPHTQLFATALWIFSTGLKTQHFSRKQLRQQSSQREKEKWEQRTCTVCWSSQEHRWH